MSAEEAAAAVAEAPAAEECSEAAANQSTAHLAAKAASVFKLADKNGNGQLSKRELKDYLHTDLDAREVLCGGEFKWQEIYKGLDTDGDKQFSLEVRRELGSG